MRELTYVQAIGEATEYILKTNPRSVVLGLGATYPNGLDGSMCDLAKKYKDRVFDTPCSENAVTGMAVGMAVNGMFPILHHGRIEFALHAMDQIITQAAKWDYMFGSDYPCQMLIRVAKGRQWGNGPQHTLNNNSLFAVPGLHVVCPTTPLAAYHHMIMAAQRQQPTIFLEPRWLYKTKSNIDKGQEDLYTSLMHKVPARRLMYGSDITIVAIGDMLVDVLRAANICKKHGIGCNVFALEQIFPLDLSGMEEAIRATKHLLVVEGSTIDYSTADCVAGAFSGVADETHTLTCENVPCPTAPGLTANYYPNVKHICEAIQTSVGKRGLFVPDEPSFNELNLPPQYNFADLIRGTAG